MDSGVYYSASENGFVCAECSSQKQPFYLTQEAVRYLACLSVCSPQEARAIPLSKEASGQIKDLVFFLIENACGSRLKSLETGIGIL